MRFLNITLIGLIFFVVACEGTMDADMPSGDIVALEAGTDPSPEVDGPADSPEPFIPHSPARQPDAPDPEDSVFEDDPIEMEDPSLPGLIVMFEISAGTGSGPWNSMETAPTIYVDQILRIVNNDSQPHRLHVPSGGPFPHGQSIPPGAQVEYLVRAPWPLQERAGMYDHDFGPSAGFWLQAIE